MQTEPMEFSDHFGSLCSAFRGEGALLVVRGRDGLANPMTIGWGTVGVVWGRPVFTVLVRGSRYTFGLIEDASAFTVCVPDGDMHEALQYCGTRSGRDGDKMEACNLTVLDGQLPDTAVVAEAAYFYECELIHKNDVLPIELAENIVSQYYPSGDFHRVYFGQIRYAYRRLP